MKVGGLGQSPIWIHLHEAACIWAQGYHVLPVSGVHVVAFSPIAPGILAAPDELEQTKTHCYSI